MNLKLNIPRDLFKRVDTYFWMLPAAAAVWALLAAFVFYPAGVQAWEDQQQEYKQAEDLIGQILDMEPQRLAYKEEKGQSGEFDFTGEVNRFAQVCGIAHGSYILQTRGEILREGKKSKSADVTIKSADIETSARFVSSLLIRWPDLQCEQLTLEKLSSGKNDWKVQLRFTYYF